MFLYLELTTLFHVISIDAHIRMKVLEYRAKRHASTDQNINE